MPETSIPIIIAIKNYCILGASMLIGAFARPIFDNGGINWKDVAKRFSGGVVVLSIILTAVDYYDVDMTRDYVRYGVIVATFYSSDVLIAVGLIIKKAVEKYEFKKS